MGTFKLYPDAVPSQLGGSWHDDGFSWATVYGNEDSIIRFIFSGNCFKLDLDPTPVSLAGLPSGFTPLTAQITVNNPSGGIQSHQFGARQYDIFTEEPLIAGPMQWGLDGPFVYPGAVPPVIDVVSNGMGFRAITTTTPSPGFVFIPYTGFGNTIYIEGTYDAFAYSWTLEPVQEPILPGARITARSIVNLNGINFTQLININPAAPTLSETYIQYLDGDGNTVQVFIPVVNFLFITITLYVFFLPAFPVDPVGDIELFVTGNGTQFSGSVSLGILQIMNANGSGIYRITKDKRSDSRYDRNQPGEITEVKIPNPIAKTGYIGG